MMVPSSQWYLKRTSKKVDVCGLYRWNVSITKPTSFHLKQITEAVLESSIMLMLPDLVERRNVQIDDDSKMQLLKL